VWAVAVAVLRLAAVLRDRRLVLLEHGPQAGVHVLLLLLLCRSVVQVVRRRAVAHGHQPVAHRVQAPAQTVHMPVRVPVPMPVPALRCVLLLRRPLLALLRVLRVLLLRVLRLLMWRLRQRPQVFRQYRVQQRVRLIQVTQ
jgi:hypothetical protein